MSADGGEPPPPRPQDFVPEAFCDEGEEMLATALSTTGCRRWWCSSERRVFCVCCAGIIRWCQLDNIAEGGQQGRTAAPTHTGHQTIDRVAPRFSVPDESVAVADDITRLLCFVAWQCTTTRTMAWRMKWITWRAS